MNKTQHNPLYLLLDDVIKPIEYRPNAEIDSKAYNAKNVYFVAKVYAHNIMFNAF